MTTKKKAPKAPSLGEGRKSRELPETLEDEVEEELDEELEDTADEPEVQPEEETEEGQGSEVAESEEEEKRPVILGAIRLPKGTTKPGAQLVFKKGHEHRLAKVLKLKDKQRLAKKGLIAGF